MKWWGYVLIGVCIFAVGFVLGRAGRKPVPITVDTKVPDAGPTTTAVVSTGPVSCDAGVVVKIVQGKPRIIYLPADAGTYECPACPEVTVVATAGTLAGPTTASATATTPPPIIVTKVEYRETHRNFGVGPAFTKPYEVGGLGYGVTVQYQPFNWLELTGTFTSKEVMLSPTVRF